MLLSPWFRAAIEDRKVGGDYLMLLPCQVVFDAVFDLNHAQAMPWLTLYYMYGSAFFTQGERFIS